MGVLLQNERALEALKTEHKEHDSLANEALNRAREEARVERAALQTSMKEVSTSVCGIQEASVCGTLGARRQPSA